LGFLTLKSEFVHASKNNGVTVSKIDANYWGNISGRPAVFCPHLKTNKPAAVSNIFSIDKLEIGTNLK